MFVGLVWMDGWLVFPWAVEPGKVVDGRLCSSIPSVADICVSLFVCVFVFVSLCLCVCVMYAPAFELNICVALCLHMLVSKAVCRPLNGLVCVWWAGVARFSFIFISLPDPTWFLLEATQRKEKRGDVCASRESNHRCFSFFIEIGRGEAGRSKGINRTFRLAKEQK